MELSTFLQASTSVWGMLNQNLIANLIGTFLGVLLALYFNDKQEARKKEHTYEVIADQIVFEWVSNQQYAKEILAAVESGKSTVLRFNLKIVESALGHSSVYEFAPKEFIKKLRNYRENLIIINSLLDHYFVNSNTTPDVEKLKNDLQSIISLIEDLGKVPIK